MLEAMQNRSRGTQILLGVFLVMIAFSMLISLLPGTISAPEASPDMVAEVEGRVITAADVQKQLNTLAAGRNIPQQILPLYARQVLDQMVNERLLEAEAERLGITVTKQELAERIRLISPSAKAGNLEQYTAEVNERMQMSVPEFEEAVRKSLLAEKFAQLVTDGVSVTPEEVGEEFRKRSEKIKIEFALIKPDDLEAKVTVTDADLSAHYEKNKAEYQVPERRSVRFALLDAAQLRARATVSEEELRAYYTQHQAQYRKLDRAMVSHILFKTVGKTDAEVEEIRKRAEDVLKQARGKARFEDLARKYSEDTSKDKGGDLGWLVPGQTVPEFEKAAFSLAKGALSDVVKTQFGFHILKVMDREKARTESFDEVRAAILPVLTSEKADRALADATNQITSFVRQNPKATLEDLAKRYKMTLGEAGPAAARESLGELGMAPELDEALVRLKPGELGSPVQIGRGTVVLLLDKVEPAHQGAIAEVRERLTADVRRAKSGDLAKSRAEELAARAKAGTPLAAAGKAAGFEVKTSDPIARADSIPDVGSVRPIASAFALAPGQMGPATFLGANWIVYRVVSREPMKPEDIIRGQVEVREAVLSQKRNLAFEAFREALKDKADKAGRIQFNQENLARLTSGS
jgi:peptidyl-prolyl cis-trans isomerase D